MSSQLNEFQNATVGMTVGVIEVCCVTVCALYGMACTVRVCGITTRRKQKIYCRLIFVCIVLTHNICCVLLMFVFVFCCALVGSAVATV